MESYQVDFIISALFMISSAIFHTSENTLWFIWGFVAAFFMMFGVYEMFIGFTNIYCAG